MPVNQKRLRVVLYARFSPRPDANECDSIERQFERLRAWCVAKDAEVVGEYSDADASGGTMVGRTGLEKALAHVCRIRGTLAVYDLSRLSRKAADALAISERLVARKCNLMFLIDQIDTTTDIGALIFTVQAGVAEYMRKTAAKRTSNAMRAHQSKGRRMGRADRCPFGWRPVAGTPGALEQVPEEQAAVARMRELRAAGATYRAICEALDKEGFGRRGKQWAGRPGVVKTILERKA